MMSYIAKRGLLSLFAVYLIATVTFCLMHLVPGDPLRQEKAVPEAVRQNLKARYGLDKPVLEQYALYMKKMFLEGDFGISFKQAHRSVNQIIGDHFWISALLGTIALGYAMILGIFIGSLSAMCHGTWLDRCLILKTTLGVSIPSFCLAYLYQDIFASKLNLLPAGGWDNWRSLILPAASLGTLTMSSIARLMRSSMLDTMHQDFVRTAQAKGLAKWQVVWRHQIPNALLPVIAYCGPLFASLTTGTFVVESIFGVPGLGQFFVSSVAELDYTVIMGLTVFYAAFLIGVMFLNDALCTLIDPRIRMA